MSLTSYRAAPPRGGGVGAVGGAAGAGAVGAVALPIAGAERCGLGSGALGRGPGGGAPPLRSGWPGPGRELGFGAWAWGLRSVGLGLCGGLASLAATCSSAASCGSTIGAEGFHGRVRDGIGCFAPRYGHQAGQTSVRAAARGLGARWAAGGGGFVNDRRSGLRGGGARGAEAGPGVGPGLGLVRIGAGRCTRSVLPTIGVWDRAGSSD